MPALPFLEPDKASIVNELYIALGDDVLLYSPCRIQYP